MDGAVSKPAVGHPYSNVIVSIRNEPVRGRVNVSDPSGVVQTSSADDQSADTDIAIAPDTKPGAIPQGRVVGSGGVHIERTNTDRRIEAAARVGT
jgi:hypothetical protein